MPAGNKAHVHTHVHTPKAMFWDPLGLHSHLKVAPEAGKAEDVSSSSTFNLQEVKATVAPRVQTRHCFTELGTATKYPYKYLTESMSSWIFHL